MQYFPLFSILEENWYINKIFKHFEGLLQNTCSKSQLLKCHFIVNFQTIMTPGFNATNSLQDGNTMRLCSLCWGSEFTVYIVVRKWYIFFCIISDNVFHKKYVLFMPCFFLWEDFQYIRFVELQPKCLQNGIKPTKDKKKRKRTKELKTNLKAQDF